MMMQMTESQWEGEVLLSLAPILDMLVAMDVGILPQVLQQASIC